MACGCQICFFIMKTVLSVWLKEIISEGECPCSDAPKSTHNTTVRKAAMEHDPLQSTKSRTHLP